MGRRTGRHRLPRIVDNEFKCPRCGARICWTVHGGQAGSKGYAYCSRSIHATQIWEKSKGPPNFCIWKGEAERLRNGNVDIWDDLQWLDHPHP